MAKKTYNLKQFVGDDGKFSKDTFDIREVDREYIKDTLSRRNKIELDFEDYEKLMANSNEGVGVIFRLLFNCSRNVDFLYPLINGSPEDRKALIDNLEKQIKGEVKDQLLARDCFRDFQWILKSIRLAAIGYIQTCIRNSINRKGKQESDTPESNFIPPTLDEVIAYVNEKGYNFDPELFLAYYEANGWIQGNRPVKNWKACCVSWEKNGDKYNY